MVACRFRAFRAIANNWSADSNRKKNVKTECVSVQAHLSQEQLNLQCAETSSTRAQALAQ